MLKIKFCSALPYFGWAAFLLFGLAFPPGANSQVLREDDPTLAGQKYPCLYKWSDPGIKPIAVVVAVHGVTLHGLIFDALAKHLAERGFVTLAPDMRGYGRWCNQQTSTQVAYDQSLDDLRSIIQGAKTDYPTLPLYCLGESLGAGIALAAAADKPCLVDGLILSSPAIKRRLNLVPRVLEDAAKAVANPAREVDLIPYLKKFVSEDPRVTNEAINDPLVRKRLSAWDLLKTVRSINSTLKYADKVKSNVPVLVIQGSADKVLQSKAIVQLLARLPSEDQTVKWFKDRGHLMLETAYLHNDVVQMVDQWLDEHVSAAKMAMQISDISSQAEFSLSSFNQSEQN